MKSTSSCLHLGQMFVLRMRARLSRPPAQAMTPAPRARPNRGLPPSRDPCLRVVPMIGEALVRPLEDGWRDVLDRIARARGWPGSADVARLGANVAALSAAYNDAGVAAGGAAAMAARL